MNDLRDRIAQALEGRMSRLLREAGVTSQLADAVMPIVNELAADLDHAERENRRLRGDLERTIREAARLVEDDSRSLGMMDAADIIKQVRLGG